MYFYFQNLSYERDGSCGINAGCESEGCRCDLDSMKEAYNLDEPDFQGVHFKCNNETMGVIIGNVSFFYIFIS